MFERFRGRREREVAERRAALIDAQLGVAADIAIFAARREWNRRMPTLALKAQAEHCGRVDVEDVLTIAREYFGLTAVPHPKAAAVLRNRFELRAGSVDLLTDAYERQHLGHPYLG
ncbi:hypothetical protein [Actinacidiphila glaucinigra]|uniref:hypothetical protein n=1 Tax=Actinacidiphila glaucinigra TaxID=235986 RepID=UPI0035DCFDD3